MYKGSCYLIETRTDGGDYGHDFHFITSCCGYEFDADDIEYSDIHYCPVCGKLIEYYRNVTIPDTKCRDCYYCDDGTEKTCKELKAGNSCYIDQKKRLEEALERTKYEELKKKFEG